MIQNLVVANFARPLFCWRETSVQGKQVLLSMSISIGMYCGLTHCWIFLEETVAFLCDHISSVLYKVQVSLWVLGDQNLTACFLSFKGIAIFYLAALRHTSGRDSQEKVWCSLLLKMKLLWENWKHSRHWWRTINDLQWLNHLGILSLWKANLVRTHGESSNISFHSLGILCISW